MTEKLHALNKTSSKAPNIQNAFDFLEQLFHISITSHIHETDNEKQLGKLPQIVYIDDDSALSDFIRKKQPTYDEYVIFLLALVPHVRPNFLYEVIKKETSESGDIPEIGGIIDKKNRIFFPTVNTAIFLLAGDDPHKRIQVAHILTSDHWFANEGIIEVAPAKKGESCLRGKLIINKELIRLLDLDQYFIHSFSSKFPSSEICTELEWNDLILPHSVLKQIEDLKSRIFENDALRDRWQKRRKINTPISALFFGPPGTGKTMTIKLLAKYTNKDLFRIDLSRVVTKYIDETEKSLKETLDKASDMDYAKAKSELIEAVAQIEALKKLRKKK